ncbi:hypothetical protein ACIQXA_08515 [Streptomyces massasporeus]|uniref:hypothetical protein n=1 Tax=Streptomyces massasporeus TaxID=67324 RepID=UPI003825841E
MSASREFARRWQRDAYQALGEFLQPKDLPAIAWTIATTGALVGDVDSLASTPAEQRAAFAAWTRHLNADAAPERTGEDGVTHLYAKFRWQGDRVRGAIRATIYPPMDDEGGES